MKLDAQLDYLVKKIADPLIKVLAFVERFGLHLDDHYHMARTLTQEYLRDHQP
jgi:DNA polymerase I-like protein with 3'-5' exonuclease and polymerase domains